MTDTLTTSSITDIRDVPEGTQITYLGGGSDPSCVIIMAGKGNLWRGRDQGIGSWKLVFGYDTYPGDLDHVNHGYTRDQGYWYVNASDGPSFAIATPVTPDTGVIENFGDLAVGTRLRLDTPNRPLYTGVWEVVRHDTDDSTSLCLVEQAHPEEDGYPTTGTTEWFWHNYDEGDSNSAKAFRPVTVEPSAPRDSVVLASSALSPDESFRQYLDGPTDEELEFAYLTQAVKVAEAELTDERRARRLAEQRAESAVDTYKEEVRDYILSIKDSHGWCNAGTTRHLEAIDCRGVAQDYEVQVTVTYSTTITVTAEDEDAAGELVRCNVDDYVDMRYESWDDVTIGCVDEA
jgi:hypothetical protein